MKTEQKIYKVGDWVFCEFKLQMIKSVHEDGSVTEVSDGYFSHGSGDLRDRIFPLSLRGKGISEEFHRTSKALHNIKGSNSLNYPDFNRFEIDLWVEAMQDVENTERVSACFAKLKKFEAGIIDAIEIASTVEILGVRLYRQH